MALEGTYEYECMRAELLEIEKPDYEEFMKNKAEREAAEKAELDAEADRELQAINEHLEQTGGKLDELGHILKSTQRKINNITAPFSTYFKSKIGLRGSASSSKDKGVSQVDEVIETQLESDRELQKEPEEKVPDCPTDIKNCSGGKDKDLTLNHTSRIDTLIEKTEKHVLGMQYQIKQMRRSK